jgi:hypothetical protein
MAQIMRYWAYPVVANATNYNYCLMPEYLHVDSSDYVNQRDAVARLIRDAGVGAGTNYCAWGDCSSSASDLSARNSLVNDFNYDNSANLRNKVFYTDGEWKNLLRNDLNKGMPVYYSGMESLTSGHAFICTGYDENDDDFFWFNFGWGGYDDGYRYIDNICTDNGNYNKRQNIITGLKPDSEYDCNNEITVQQFYKISLPFLFYEPMAGTIYSTTSSETIIIENSDNVIYSGYNSIHLKNFRVTSGGSFIARLIECPSNCRHASPDAGKDVKNNVVKTANELYNSNNNITIYPNPTNGIFTISVENSPFFKGGKGDLKISITDLTGKVVYLKEKQGNKLIINISDKPGGIYVLQIQSENILKSYKIIKQ